MSNEPIFKLTKVNIKQEDIPAFRKEQEAELENSIPAEDGTLLFSSSHSDAQGKENYIFELYRNAKAFDVHSMADYYDHYDKVIDELADDKKVYDLKAEWITTKPKEALDSYANNFVVRMTKIEVEDGKHDEFTAMAKKEMRRAIAQEAGAEILMVGSNIQNENEFFFFEVYVNDEAYNKHLEDKWFKQYINDSEPIVKDRHVTELVRDVLACQGPIVLD